MCISKDSGALIASGSTYSLVVPKGGPWLIHKRPSVAADIKIPVVCVSKGTGARIVKGSTGSFAMTLQQKAQQRGDQDEAGRSYSRYLFII
eukprot:COSAG01_NODE_1216_length_11192_cov_10.328678_1_plen_91_part_00